MYHDRIAGGLADHYRPSDFDPVELRQGMKVEREHTSDPTLAREIAMDHLVEDPLYYRKLELMEEGALDSAIVFPLGAYKDNPDASTFWRLLSLAGGAAGAYHGYKRNEGGNPIAWALWWAFWGAVVPVVTVPVALAQGYGKPSR